MEDTAGALSFDCRVSDPDDLYEALVELNKGGDPEMDRPMLAALVLILSNQIGSAEIVKSAIEEVRAAFRRTA